MVPAEHQIACGDEGLQALLGAAETAAGEHAKLCNPMREPAFLGEHDDAIRPLDALEVRAWGAFVARVRAIAGE